MIESVVAKPNSKEQVIPMLLNLQQIMIEHGRVLGQTSFEEILSAEGLKGMVELGARRLELAEEIEKVHHPLLLSLYYDLDNQLLPSEETPTNGSTTFTEPKSQVRRGRVPGKTNYEFSDNTEVLTTTSGKRDDEMDLDKIDLESINLEGLETPQIQYETDPTIYNIYQAEVSQFPLLTAAQEIELAKQREAGVEALEKLKSGDFNTENQEGLREIINIGEAAREKLVNSNLRLVQSVARKYMNRGLAYMDLIQEGSIGLQRGVEKYDWRRGFKFSTYAHWWIRQAISRAIADSARTIRLPVHIIELLTDLNKKKSELENELGREPTFDEIAKRAGIAPVYVSLAYRAARYPVSLETPIGEDGESTIADLVPDKAILPVVEEAEQGNLSDILDEALRRHLTPREAQVLRMRHGLDDGKERTLGEIGEEFDISRERVRQIESEAIRKLRQTVPFMRQFHDYLDTDRSDRANRSDRPDKPATIKTERRSEPKEGSHHPRHGAPLLEYLSERVGGLPKMMAVAKEVLDTRELQVLELRLGLDGNQSATLDRTGTILNLSKQTVQKIQIEIMRKILDKYILEKYINV